MLEKRERCWGTSMEDEKQSHWSGLKTTLLSVCDCKACLTSLSIRPDRSAPLLLYCLPSFKYFYGRMWPEALRSSGCVVLLTCVKVLAHYKDTTNMAVNYSKRATLGNTFEEKKNPKWSIDIIPTPIDFLFPSFQFTWLRVKWAGIPWPEAIPIKCHPLRCS